MCILIPACPAVYPVGMDADEIETSIQSNATGPKKVRGDQGEIEQHSISDQLAAADRAANSTASAKAHGGLRFINLDRET